MTINIPNNEFPEQLDLAISYPKENQFTILIVNYNDYIWDNFKADTRLVYDPRTEKFRTDTSLKPVLNLIIEKYNDDMNSNKEYTILIVNAANKEFFDMVSNIIKVLTKKIKLFSLNSYQFKYILKHCEQLGYSIEDLKNV